AACALMASSSCGVLAGGQPNRGAQLGRYLLVSASIYAVFLAIDRWYQWIRFGTVFSTYQHLWAQQLRATRPDLPANFPFSTPLSVGAWGALFSPERSVFLFEPLLVLTPLLLILLRGRISRPVQAVVGTATLLLGGYVCFYGRWFDWSGASSWGDRFLTGPTELIALIAIALLARHGRELSRLLAALSIAVLALAVFIQLESLAFWYLLEETQHAQGLGTRFTVVQRAINIAALVSTRFRAWGLDPGGPAAELRPNFFFWKLREYLPPTSWSATAAAWACGVLVLSFAVAAKVRALSRQASPPRTRETALPSS
ncbi:MAG TPA: hypothetical protein VMK12_29820, partial [Anaeromyxobacteraceae bacterium]|nr:hypothetical protein [Anaeromyxobacteraceae bacterium]